VPVSDVPPGAQYNPEPAAAVQLAHPAASLVVPASTPYFPAPQRVQSALLLSPLLAP
jgi:hypothetical protein